MGRNYQKIEGHNYRTFVVSTDCPLQLEYAFFDEVRHDTFGPDKLLEDQYRFEFHLHDEQQHLTEGHAPRLLWHEFGVSVWCYPYPESFDNS